MHEQNRPRSKARKCSGPPVGRNGAGLKWDITGTPIVSGSYRCMEREIFNDLRDCTGCNLPRLPWVALPLTRGYSDFAPAGQSNEMIILV